MTDLKTLITKLESAKEGSWDLSQRVGKATGGEKQYQHPGSVRLSHLNYTTSLDAALTLVPEGLKLLQLGEWSDGWYAQVGPHHKQRAWKVDQIQTPALALCIAALKARENN